MLSTLIRTEPAVAYTAKDIIPLSQARAQSVADRIAAVRPDLSLTVTGHGSSDPVANEYPGGKADDDAMAQNRRVEITITA